MKINVTVDLSEMYAAENCEINRDGEIRSDCDFTTAIKEAIKREVVDKVLAEWRRECMRNFADGIQDHLKDLRDGFLAGIMAEVAKEKTVEAVRYGFGPGEKVSIIDMARAALAQYWCEKQFDGKVREIAQGLANEQAKALRDRYDLIFATQLVSKLNDGGMLRDDVAKLLLAPPTA